MFVKGARAKGRGTAACVALTLALATALVSCGRAEPIVPAAAPQPGAPRPAALLPPSLVEQLSELASYPIDLGYPGAITFVDIEGVGSWTSPLGRSGPGEESAPVSADSVFAIGSITKTFTATAVLRLVADPDVGLSLDQTLSSFTTVPDLPNDDEITVRQLLQHTSGVADYAGNQTFACIILPGCQGDQFAPATQFLPADLVTLAGTMTPLGAPGEGWHYSNTNYVVLGMIIEEVTDQSAEEVITELVIEPLGLNNTTFPTSPEDAAALLTTRPSLVTVEGTTVLGTYNYAVSNPSAYWTAGAITSTVGDLDTWVHALAQGTLLPLDLQLERLRTVPATTFPPLAGFPGQPVDVRYGLGIASFDLYLGHNGAVPGYESLAVYDAETGTTIVMLLNAWILEESDQSGTPTISALEVATPSALLPSFIAILGGRIPNTR